MTDDARKPMTREELAEIRRIWAATTPGPWLYDPMYDRISKPKRVDKHDHVVSGGYEAGEVYMSREDGAAIAKAPEHIAALLAEVELAWKFNTELQQELHETKNALREAESEASTAVALSNGECPSCGGRVEKLTPDKHSSLHDPYFQCVSCGDIFDP